MDQNVTLTEIMERIARILEANDHEQPPDPKDAVELAEKTLALHVWLERGGSLPKLWTNRVGGDHG